MKKEPVQLSDHFTYGKLLRFVYPSVMMIFTSIYGVVDGLFVANFVGKTSFAAINLVMPFFDSIETPPLRSASEEAGKRKRVGSFGCSRPFGMAESYGAGA